MNVKKAIQELEGKFNSHEIWTRAEIQQVLNFYWLEINAREQLICSVTKKPLQEDQIYRNEDDSKLYCNCHKRRVEEKMIIQKENQL